MRSAEYRVKMVDSFTGNGAVNRRTMLSRCFVAAALPRWLRTEIRYRRLETPAVVPLEAVSEAWRPAAFRARCSKTAGHARREVLLRGMVLRLPGAAGLKAFALNCPHELCELNLAQDTGSAPWPPEARRSHPVLVCPCHFSVFDPLADGAAISGPAARGAYRFRWKVRGSRVEIREVEEEALGG